MTSSVPDTRPRPSTTAGDRESLVQFLDYQRETLAMKCAGLTAGQLRERAVPPSAMSLLGLVRHLAAVERSWFRHVVDGEGVRAVWDPLPAGEADEFDVATADPDEVFEAWRAECARSREIVAAVESLDATTHYAGHSFSLRYVLTHLVEEYARHNGHADLLRERLDGTTGE